MRYTVLCVLGLVALTVVPPSRAGDEPVMMRDLANPPGVGSTVTLVRQFSLDPFLCNDYFALMTYAEAIRAKDVLGVEELLKRNRGRSGQKGTTALILETIDEPLDRKRQASIERQIADLSARYYFPLDQTAPESIAQNTGKISEMKALREAKCVKVRITSGSEKGQSAYVDYNFIGSLIPTRVRVGEAGVLRKESAYAVRVYDKVETYNNHLSDWIAFEPKLGEGRLSTIIDGMLLDEVDTAYSNAGKLLLLRDGARVKILGFVEPGEHPSLTQTLAYVEILIPPRNRKKLQGKKGYVRAFEVYKDVENKTKRKRKS